MQDKMNIDNCFIDELSNYNYDIMTPDGLDLICTAKSMSVLDTSAIQKHSFSIARNEDGSVYLDKSGMPVYDINVMLWELFTIKQALVKWRWKDKDITLENIAKLSDDVRHHIFSAIRRHEGYYESQKEAIAKN